MTTTTTSGYSVETFFANVELICTVLPHCSIADTEHANLDDFGWLAKVARMSQGDRRVAVMNASSFRQQLVYRVVRIHVYRVFG